MKAETAGKRDNNEETKIKTQINEKKEVTKTLITNDDK